jgi:hypothetical protein
MLSGRRQKANYQVEAQKFKPSSEAQEEFLILADALTRVKLWCLYHLPFETTKEFCAYVYILMNFFI